MTRKQITDLIQAEFASPKNVDRPPCNEVDAFGTNPEPDFGMCVVSLNISEGKITKMNWTMPKCEMYGAAFASLLSQIIPGLTVAEAYSISLLDVEARFGFKWPRAYRAFTTPAILALRGALEMNLHGLNKR